MKPAPGDVSRKGLKRIADALEEIAALDAYYRVVGTRRINQRELKIAVTVLRSVADGETPCTHVNRNALDGPMMEAVNAVRAAALLPKVKDWDDAFAEAARVLGKTKQTIKRHFERHDAETGSESVFPK